ncbi:TetR/AcrR family transcriptional regulator [Aeromicrobium endophyticum]|nr:TetR/AcrR family transcriptional regulator [Aeromicrobium endophyticum]
MATRVWNDQTGPARYVAPDPDFWDPKLSDAARRLLGSAVLCFARNGFYGTRTRDISAGAKLSAGSLYTMFDSKEAVFFEITRSGHIDTLACLNADPGDGTPTERLQRLVSIYVEWHARYHTVGRACQHDLAVLTEEHFAEIVELRHQIEAIFRNVVEEGAKDNTFDAADIDGVLRAIHSLSIDVTRWYGLDGTESPQSIAALYSKFALRIATPPPSS